MITNANLRPKNILCLTIDRLHVGYVGCYGNCWIGTPAFDRLASQSLAFDQAIIDAASLDELYASYWQGTHALERTIDGITSDGTSLATQLRGAGFRALLTSDEPAVLSHPLAVDFDEAVAIDSLANKSEAHDGASLATFFAAACETLPSLQGPYFWWLHTGSLGRWWDAPLSFRNQYADEDEAPPPEIVAPPCRRLPPEHDPDEILGVVQSYAGQVAYLDSCLGSFLDAFDASPASADTLLIVNSARGFPLGEHGRLGPFDDRPGGELVHVPWLWRFPDRRAASARTSALVQPADLRWTLLDLIGIPTSPPKGLPRSLVSVVEDELAPIRDAAHTIASQRGWAVRTAEWHLCHYDEAGGAESRLYAKPDDRWELSDVADRCSDVVENLQRIHAHAVDRRCDL